MSATKFAKKGSLVIDVKAAKIAKVGDTDLKSKKILKAANIEEAPEGKKTKAEKPAKEVKAVKGKAPKAEKSAKEARNSYADKKIKVVNKDHGARDGSKRAAWMNALIKSKTVAEAQGKVEGLDSGVIGFAVRSGLIELV